MTTPFVRYIRIGLIVLITMTSLTNLLGWPSMVIDDSFSNMCIPGQMLNATQKRILTGLLEMIALLLIANKPTRSIGFLQTFLMLFRGAYLNGHEYDFMSVAAGLGSLASLVCLKPELIELAEKLEEWSEKLASEAKEEVTKKTKEE